jgi:hypothetical protein
MSIVRIKTSDSSKDFSNTFARLTIRGSKLSGLMMSASGYLLSLPKPDFKPGHTLPQQSNFGYGYHFGSDVAKVLADRFNYNLRLPYHVDELRDSRITQDIIAIYDSNPSKYRMGILLRGAAPVNASTPYRRADGSEIGYYSPWYDQAATNLMLDYHRPFLEWAASRFNLGIIQNPAEYAQSAPASNLGLMAQDVRYSSKLYYQPGESDLHFYNRRKGEQETQLANLVRSICPNRQAYQNYNMAGIPDINTYYTSDQYGFDFSLVKDTTDYPCGSLYFSEFNEGFTSSATGGAYWGGRDLWTQSVSNYHQQLASGKKLSINYVTGGWHERGTVKFFSRIDLYRGYLKSLYMLGNISTISGFFQQYSENNIVFNPELGVPHWLTDLVSAGYVQAIFSWLEDYLRVGTLLPGDGTFRFNAALPSYEFGGASPARVLVRKLDSANKWLISAWSPDAESRAVRITVPVLGIITIQATAACNLYTCNGVGALPVLVPYQPVYGLETGYIAGDVDPPLHRNIYVNSNFAIS